jgi:hypothetical protein
MSKNLPVRARSRNIQKQHKRKYRSGKVSLVNRGVTKPNSSNIPATRTIKPRQSNLTPRSKPQSISVTQNRKFQLKPRTITRWTDVFKPLSNNRVKEIERMKYADKIKKYGFTQDHNGVWLYPGEISFKKYLGIDHQFPSAIGELIMEDWQGNKIGVITEMRSGFGRIHNFLEDDVKRGNNCILAINDDGFITNVVGVREYKDLPLGMMIESFEEYLESPGPEMRMLNRNQEEYVSPYEVQSTLKRFEKKKEKSYLPDSDNFFQLLESEYKKAKENNKERFSFEFDSQPYEFDTLYVKYLFEHIKNEQEKYKKE